MPESARSQQTATPPPHRKHRRFAQDVRGRVRQVVNEKLPLSDIGRRFLKGLSWIALFFTFARATSFLTQFVAARVLGPSQYGVSHLIIATSSTLQILPLLGFTLALSRFGSLETDDEGRRKVVSTTFWAYVVWSTTSGVLFASAFPWISSRTGLGAESMRLALSFAFINATYLVVSSALQGLSRFRERGTTEAIYSLTAAATFALLLTGQERGYELLINSLLSGFVIATFYALWQLKSYIGFRFDRRLLVDLLPFSLLGTVTVVSAAMIQAPGRILVYHCCSPLEAGIYSAYFTATVQIGQALTFMAYTVIVPFTSRAEGQKKAWTLLRRNAPLAFGALVAFFTIGAVAALSLIGKDYPLRPDWVLLFALAATLTLMHGAVSVIFAARDVRGLIISSIGTLTAGVGHLILNIVLTPRLNVTGAALALCLGYALGLCWYILYWPKSAENA